MSTCFEFEGKTVEKAVKKACDELNIPPDQLKHDVVSYGSTGIFGLVGIKKARIRVIMTDAESQELPVESASSTNLDQQILEDVDSLIKETFNEADPQKDSVSAVCALGTDVLQRILDVITEGAVITADERKDRILFKVDGGNSSVLIGKRGQTLEAIQYLVEKVVNKSVENRVRIQVDVEGYLGNREVRLQDLARRLADKTKRSGKPSTIGQMNSHDRRIIHLTLKDDPDVRTQSIGDGYLRKLMIFPKKRSGKKRASQTG